MVRKYIKHIKKVIFLLILTSFSLAQESKRIYTGLRLGGSVGMTYPIADWKDYFGGNKVKDYKWREGGSFDISPFLTLQITNRFALQTEVMITKFGYYGRLIEHQEYEYGYYYIDHIKISRRALVFPILLKHTYHRKKISIQCYIGPHFTANIGKWESYDYMKVGHKSGIPEKRLFEGNSYNNILGLEYIPPIGLTTGLNFGYIATKAGTIFFDTRALGDLGVIKRYGKPYLYRAKLSFSLGWEFGFVNISDSEGR